MAQILPFIIAGVLVFLLSLVLPTAWGAPWIPSSRRAANRMLDLAKLSPGQVVFDLGCGDGRILFRAWKRYGATGMGVDINPWWVAFCRAKARLLGAHHDLLFLWGNLFRLNLRQADVVTLYLLQITNDRLEEKLSTELRPGSRVVSHRFTLPGWTLIDRSDRFDINVYEKTVEQHVSTKGSPG